MYLVLCVGCVGVCFILSSSFLILCIWCQLSWFQIGARSNPPKDLEKDCKTKDEEWAARCKLRSEELLAIADTIKILNDDDAPPTLAHWK